MPTRLCSDCLLLFILRNQRSLRCPPCAQKRIAQQKKDSQQKCRPERRQRELYDISAAEIDARFTAALKEIRRQSTDSLEPFRSFSWQYREPRS